MVQFIGNVQNRQIYRDKKVDAPSLQAGVWGGLGTAGGYQVSFKSGDNVLLLDSGDGCPFLRMSDNIKV